MENCFAEKKELALAKEYAQIYRIVLELFDKFAELLGDEGKLHLIVFHMGIIMRKQQKSFQFLISRHEIIQLNMKIAELTHCKIIEVGENQKTLLPKLKNFELN